MLGINHQSPFIYLINTALNAEKAGNQSPIPFDILIIAPLTEGDGWESITNPL